MSGAGLILYDVYCGGGGATRGYQKAGFYVIGVDNKPQPRYCGDEFILMDALEFLRRYLAGEYQEAHAFHTSPPCQAYTAMQNIHKNIKNHPDLVEETRALLEKIGKPYVIENVAGAPLKANLMLCGTMFGLRIIRHRYFEVPTLPMLLLPPCDHSDVYDPWHGEARTANKFREAMDIDWMPVGGGSQKSGTIDEAIPPAYCEFIGKQLLRVLEQQT